MADEHDVNLGVLMAHAWWTRDEARGRSHGFPASIPRWSPRGSCYRRFWPTTFDPRSNGETADVARRQASGATGHVGMRS
jgi:hypothetical protein